ncbi:MAG TPA: PQQ-binding-like beta-propeller repeat protein [Planctomycetota bacterium]
MLGAWLLVPLWLRAGDPFGDRGMSNVFTGLWLVLSGLALLVWFLRRRSLARGLRLGVAGGVGLLLALVLQLVRVTGVSGEMLPRFAWRWSEPPAAAPERRATIALAPPGPDDFPGFLGPRRDNAVPAARLARDWSATPPRLRWRAPIGAGWSAFAVAGGWAFTLEQDAAGQHVSVRALADGSVGWSVMLDQPFEHVLGGDGPRSTPAVVLGAGEGRVVALSARGRLACLAAQDGELLWDHELGAEHGLAEAEELERAQYGRASSPLVAGELVIVPAGGEAGLVAYELASGALRWRSPARGYSYASPALATLGGVAQVLAVNEATLSGHALADGRLLWEHPWPGSSSGDANVSQAWPLAPERVFVSKGYGGGALMLALEAGAAGELVARELWHAPRTLRTKFTNVVVHAGHAYGLDDGMLACLDLASGERRWKEGRYGHGQVLLAGGLLLLCSEEGEVVLLEPDPARPNAVLGRFQALEGKCWAHLALAGNLLLLRNAEQCAAWELPREL